MHVMCKYMLKIKQLVAPTAWSNMKEVPLTMLQLNMLYNEVLYNGELNRRRLGPRLSVVIKRINRFQHQK